ncbi:MAG: flagellar biosynthesis repressor FlbT [Alphaproteobacteria bacterium]
MALKISLKAGEKIIINGAVIVNGGDRAQFVLQNRANILREKDIITEERADTPAKRIYFTVQMMHLFPEHVRDHQENFNSFLQQFAQAVPSSTTLLLEIGQQMIAGDSYGALKKCRNLIRYEQEVLNYAGSA